MPSNPYPPITSSDLLDLLHKHRLRNLFPLGLNSSGQLVLLVETLRDSRKKAGKIVEDWVQTGLTVTDLLAQTGQILVVAPAGFANWFEKDSAGNPQVFVAPSDIVIKTAVIQTTGTAGNRQLFGRILGTDYPLSSKTVPATTTGDLLDHEIAIPSGGRISVGNGDVADKWVVTYVRLN